MPYHYKAIVDAPHAENGTMERTIDTQDPNELVNQIVGVARDNPGKEFAFKITATEVHTADSD
jgi:hypothetical protein